MYSLEAKLGDEGTPLLSGGQSGGGQKIRGKIEAMDEKGTGPGPKGAVGGRHLCRCPRHQGGGGWRGTVYSGRSFYLKAVSLLRLFCIPQFLMSRNTT